jgi:hypothetical protein
VLAPVSDGRVSTPPIPIPPSPPGSGVATGIGPFLPASRMNAPLFPRGPQGGGEVPRAGRPFFPGRMTGGRLPPASPGTDSASPVVPRVVRTFAVVDLNSAPLADLQTLPGMTADYAPKIIAGRPYRSFREVVERSGIPQAIVEQMTPPAILRVLEHSPAGAAGPSRQPQP